MFPLLTGAIPCAAVPLTNHAPPPLKLLERVRWHMRVKRYSICTVQELLGHKDVSTTMVYTHVLGKPGLGVLSPLDDEITAGVKVPSKK